MIVIVILKQMKLINNKKCVKNYLNKTNFKKKYKKYLTKVKKRNYKKAFDIILRNKIAGVNYVKNVKVIRRKISEKQYQLQLHQQKLK